MKPTLRLGKTGWVGIMLALFLATVTFRTFGEEPSGSANGGAAAAEAPSGERISNDGMVDVEGEVLGGVLERLNLNQAFEHQSAQTPNQPAAKKKDEEEAADAAKGGEAQGELDLAPLKLTDDQIAAVEKAIGEGVDLTALTKEELAQYGFKPEQAELFAQMLTDANRGGAEARSEEVNLAELGLSAEQEAAVQKILDAKGTGGIKPEEVAQIKKDLETAKAEAARLQTELAGKKPVATAVAPLHPVFMLNDPAKLAQREQEIMQFEKWALANWDGVEEVPAEGDKPGTPGFSKEQVRTRYAELQQERQTLIPRARQLLAQQQHADNLAYEAYPELKDAKSPEAVLVDTILKNAPGLAAIFPNVRMIIADAIQGEKARLAKAKAAPSKRALKIKLGGAGGNGADNGVSSAARKVAPKLPIGARPSRPAANGGRANKPADTIDERAFIEMKNGGTNDRDALVALLGKSNLVGKS